MNPEVNAVLAEVKAQMASMDNPKSEVDVNATRLPDFSTMSIMKATEWCMANHIDKPQDIARTTGKKLETIHTAMWKIRKGGNVSSGAKAYPKHVKSLEDRVLSALKTGCRTATTIHTYVGKDVAIKVLNMKLGSLVSRGLIGKKKSVSTGHMKYYPYDEALAKGCLQEPKPKKNPFEFKPDNRLPSFVPPRSLQIAEQLKPMPIDQDRENYILFLEKRVTEWQTEARRLQHEVDAKAKREVRNVAYDQALEQIELLRKEVKRLTIIIEYYEGKAGK
jgi:hypothetical protein